MNQIVPLREKFYSRATLSTFGFTGTGIILSTMLITALVYKSPSGQLYNPLNHFISELGFVGVSEFAWLFNSGLFIGGLVLAFFMWGLADLFKTKSAEISSIIGIIASLLASLVGIFSMNNLDSHIIVSLGFFFTGMITIILFSTIIFIDKREILPKSLALYGLVLFLIFLIFLFNPFDSSATSFSGSFNADTINHLDAIRPSIWGIAIMEWLSVLGVNFWIIVVSILVFKKNHLSKISKEQ